MKFADLYLNLQNNAEVRMCLVYSDKEMKCAICGDPTHFVEINYGAGYCSDECLNIEDERYFQATST